MNTNASDMTLASELSGLGDIEKGQGTLVSVVVKKKGVERGTAPNKVIYGDDTVHALIWSGFTYKALVERSYKKLHQEWDKGNLFHTLLEQVTAAGYPEVTLSDVASAVQEVDESFKKVLAEPLDDMDLPDGSGEETKAPIWEPLTIDGQTVRGAKVYIGEGNSSDPRAPVKGSVYIDGVKLGERVQVAAPNGHWKAKQKPKTVAKEILRDRLPIGLYVRYPLDKAGLGGVRVGAAASAYAKQDGVVVDPEAIRSLFKVAV